VTLPQYPCGKRFLSLQSYKSYNLSFFLKILDALLKQALLKADRLLLSPHLDEHILLPYLERELSTKYILTEKILIPEGPRIRPLYLFEKILKFLSFYTDRV
jgi:hypothetical protein